MRAGEVEFDPVHDTGPIVLRDRVFESLFTPLTDLRHQENIIGN